MTRTQENLKEMGRILTDDSKAQDIMSMLASKAEESGMTSEEWENFKASMMTSLFYMVAQKDESIRNDLAMDLYEEFTA